MVLRVDGERIGQTVSLAAPPTDAAADAGMDAGDEDSEDESDDNDPGKVSAREKRRADKRAAKAARTSPPRAAAQQVKSTAAGGKGSTV